MKSVLATIFLFSALLLQNVELQAQGVYVTQGEKGPVFSDKPQPGAREVTLPPLNVVAPPQEPRAAATGNAPPAISSKHVNPDATAGAYRTFSIVSPESDGSVVANTALFEVRVAVDPPLQLGEGHVFTVSINGRSVSQRFTANEFMIPPEFWGDALPPPNQSMQLDASIVDGDGRVLKRAAPVRFFMRHATLLNRPKRLAPPPVTPERPVAPKPAMVPDKAVGATMK